MIKVTMMKIIWFTISLSRNLKRYFHPKNIWLNTLRASGQSTKQKCVKIGNSQVVAFLVIVAHSHTESKNLTWSKIFPKIIRQDFAKDSMKNYIVPMELDVNLSIKKNHLLQLLMYLNMLTQNLFLSRHPKHNKFWKFKMMWT